LFYYSGPAGARKLRPEGRQSRQGPACILQDRLAQSLQVFYLVSYHGLKVPQLIVFGLRSLALYLRILLFI
jgi:hypothetical protein